MAAPYSLYRRDRSKDLDSRTTLTGGSPIASGRSIYAVHVPVASWAFVEPVFNIDIEHCPNCGGRLKIIAAIVDPAVIAKILTHLHLPARAPPRSPARRVDLFQAA